MPSTVRLILGAAVVAVFSTCSTLLVVAAEHDLARSLAIIGIMVGLLGSFYELLDRRLIRMEHATARIVAVERDVLHAVQHDARDRSRLN
ncbi:hypothetical protein [Actinomadura terrae]|uniref:hypothetical protein n=1 Tax=Actinomadura terrae TaxID=604353 RepID=UPI001FA760ED|nr:hypothetical protein [Actinomadura terrae]